MGRVNNSIYTPDGKNGQKVAFLAASARTSQALPDFVHAVRVYASEDCWLSFDGSAAEKTGTTASNVTSGLSMFLPAEQTEYFAAQGKATISVQGDSADGNLIIMPLTE